MDATVNFASTDQRMDAKMGNPTSTSYLPAESKPFYFNLTVNSSGEYETTVTAAEIAVASAYGRLIFAYAPYPADDPALTVLVPLAGFIQSDEGEQLAFIKNNVILVLVPDGAGSYTVVSVN